MSTQRKPEWVRQAWLCHFLERAVLSPVEVRSIDHAGSDKAGMGSRMMALGRFVKSGTPDIFCWQGDPTITVAIEVKHETDASDAQKATAKALMRCGVHVVGECRTTAEALDGLRRAGMRLHSNVDNIAIEYQARIEAGLRELAEWKATKPKAKRTRPYASRPSRAAVARGNRFTAKGLGIG